MKTCTRCQETKALEDFYFQKSRSVYSAECKVCIRARSKKTYQNNPQPYIDRATKRDEADRERYKERKRQQYMRNRAHHIEKAKLNVSKRRAAKKGADATLTSAEWSIILAENNYTCYYCPSPWEHMDHYIPLAKGGTHTADNVVPACAPCNLRKQDKDPMVFIEEMRLKNGR